MTEQFAPSPQRQDCSYCTKWNTIHNLTGIGSQVPPPSLTLRKPSLSGQGRSHQRPAATSTLEFAPTKRSSALSVMSALNALAAGTSKEALSVREAKERGEQPVKGTYPRFARDLLWEEDHYPSIKASVELSEDPAIATPMPRPPPREQFHADFLRTVDHNSDLFSIVTPINVDIFAYLLTDHPNRPFVQSVLQALKEGAWPWAGTPNDFPHGP